MVALMEWVGKTVTVDGYSGIAFHVDAIRTEADDDTIWSGIEVETGQLETHMVGDDRMFLAWPEELTVLDEDAFCHECGQVGCTHDGRERA
jgi:hypothetical protein